MLFLTESQIALRQRLFRQISQDTITRKEAFTQALASDPDDYVAMLALGQCQRDEANYDEARRYFWRALRTQPCDVQCYAFLYAALGDEGGDPELAAGLLTLALPRLLKDPEKAAAFESEIVKQIEEATGEPVEESGRGALAQLAAVLLDNPKDEPARVTELLAPYRAMDPLLDFDGAMLREEVDEILRQGSACAPLVLGVLRNWARDDDGEDNPMAVEAALGLLGEIGGPEHLPSILECISGDREDMVDEAAVWAALRLAERYPQLRPQIREVSPPPYQIDVYDLCAALDDELEPFEEEQPAPLAPPKSQRPGRNQPCWCGSGKKYKKCHLSSDEEEERTLSPLDDDEPIAAHNPLMDKLLFFAQENIRAKELKQAIELFFGPDYVGWEEDDQIAFFDWLVHDYSPRKFGRPVPLEYLVRHRHLHSHGDRRFFEERANSRQSLLEVLRIEPAVGVEVRDLLLDETFFVHDVRSSLTLQKWDCVLSRVAAEGDRRIFTGSGMNVPRHFQSGLRDWILADREETGQPWLGYLRANSHRLRQHVFEMAEDWRNNLQVQTPEGDELVFATTSFKVFDAPVLRERLLSSDELEVAEEDSGEEELTLVWLGPPVPGETSRRVLANLSLTGNELVIETSSHRRAENAASFITALAGKSIGEEGRSSQTVQEKLRDGPPAAKREPEPEIPPQIKARLVGEYLEMHYRKWPDTRLPALDGHTPREASREPALRDRLVEILKEFENVEARKRRLGDPYYDVSRLKTELEIDF